jgi:tyrosinase
VINSVAQLKVRYQGEPTIPTQTCPPLAVVSPGAIRAIEIGPRTLMTAEQPTTLAAGPTRLSMRMPGEAVRGRARSAITDPARTLVLRVEGIKVDAQPGVIYEVYVGLPAGQKPEPSSPHFVGTLSTFGAEHAGAEGMTAAWPIDAAAARALQGNPNDVQVTFVPRGLSVGNVEQPVRLQGRVSFRRMRVIEE